VGPHGSRQVPPDHPPRPAGWLGRASPAGWLGRPSPAGWLGRPSPAGRPRCGGQPAACRQGSRGARRCPLTGPPADHGVMTPSRAGKPFHAIARCAAEPGPLAAAARGPGRVPRTVDIRRGSGMLLRTVQHLASCQGELAARARLCRGPVDRPRCQAQRARACPVAHWAGGLETGRARVPSRQRRTSSRPAGRSAVRRDARALFPRLPCMITVRGRPGAEPAAACSPRRGRGRVRGPGPLCSVNIGANLAMPREPRPPMTPRNGNLQGSRARVAATPRGCQGKAGEVGWQQRSRDSGWPGRRHHAHVQRA
jgi:hypothetical protein